MVEWTASDGRKGTLTGKGKSRLTAASLARIPSDRRSTKELLAVKDTSKKSADNAEGAEASGGCGVEATNGSRKSGSKKASSNKDGPSSGSTKASQKNTSGSANIQDTGAQADAAGGDSKKGEKDTSSNTKDAAAQNTTTAENGKEKEDEESNTWTKEQDETIIQMKTENASVQWAVVAEKVGKSVEECKSRFKEIKPKDWKPNNVQNNTSNGYTAKNKNKNKNGNQNQNQGGKEGGKKVEEQKEAKKADENDDNGWAAMGFNGLMGDGNDGKQDDTANVNNTNTWEQNGTGWNSDNTNPQNTDNANNTNGWGGDDSWGNTGVNGGTEQPNDANDWIIENQTNTNGDSWNNTANAKGDNNQDIANSWDPVDAGAAPTNWDIPGQQTNNVTGSNTQPANEWPSAANAPSDPHSNNAPVDTSWGTINMQTNNDNNNNNNTGGNTQAAPAQQSADAAKPPSAPRSNKAPSESRSHRSSAGGKSKSSTHSRPLELELKPDDTFSADDLRLIARILQQDCKMVWNRVSWRFRDKTGRVLDPEVFERKITGSVEKEGSQRGEGKK